MYTFTTVGFIVTAFVLVKTAKGPWGLFVAYMLGAVIAAMMLYNYQQIISILFTKGQG